ncbi:hypothetical protein CXB51_028102 [Gossypium anomalum]|uniref:Integrase catalytic domain-containing protein n=1 Tax=Gossypium anomalum TaxID=47600 RepID=A0A8J5YGP4_9ROSI|nr:hypothetical protein CXB51_028102 [Gossypium anomalum]
MDRNMVDAASGRVLVNMTPQQTRDLISTMAVNTQQFQANPEPSRRVHQLSNSTLEDKVDKLTNIVNFLFAEKEKPARVCGICVTPEHTTDACPSLYDDTMAHLDALGNFPRPPQRLYDPYANTYNSGWRDYPNLSYRANPRYNQPYQNRVPQQPRDSEPNPTQNVNTVTLQSGKVLEPIPDRNLSQEIAQKNLENDEQGKEDKEILEIFRNVEINIPLLDVIRQIPRYATFLKELCTNKRKLTGNENVSVGENVSAVLQQKMPAKCKDRGMFAIPCKIGHLGIKKAMCDLGASTNVMSYSIYESLNAGFLTKTGVIIQLADRYIVHPEGVLEDAPELELKPLPEHLKYAFLGKANHLSRLKILDDDTPIKDEFPDESLFSTEAHYPWYTDIVNLITTDLLPTELAHSVKNKLRREKLAEVTLALNGLLTRFGTPRALISDRGTHFCNKVMEALLSKYGVYHRIATAYHYQTNGLVECNMELEPPGKARKLDIQELKEIRNDAYENTRIYKDNTKYAGFLGHDSDQNFEEQAIVQIRSLMI